MKGKDKIPDCYKNNFETLKINIRKQWDSKPNTNKDNIDLENTTTTRQLLCDIKRYVLEKDMSFIKGTLYNNPEDVNYDSFLKPLQQGCPMMFILSLEEYLTLLNYTEGNTDNMNTEMNQRCVESQRLIKRRIPNLELQSYNSLYVIPKKNFYESFFNRLNTYKIIIAISTALKRCESNLSILFLMFSKDIFRTLIDEASKEIIDARTNDENYSIILAFIILTIHDIINNSFTECSGGLSLSGESYLSKALNVITINKSMLVKIVISHFTETYKTEKIKNFVDNCTKEIKNSLIKNKKTKKRQKKTTNKLQENRIEEKNEEKIEEDPEKSEVFTQQNTEEFSLNNQNIPVIPQEKIEEENPEYSVEKKLNAREQVSKICIVQKDYEVKINPTPDEEKNFLIKKLAHKEEESENKSKNIKELKEENKKLLKNLKYLKQNSKEEKDKFMNQINKEEEALRAEYKKLECQKEIFYNNLANEELEKEEEKKRIEYEHKKEIEKLEDTIKQLRTSNNDLSNKLAELERNNKEERSTNSILRKKNEELKEENEELKEENEELKEENEEFRPENGMSPYNDDRINEIVLYLTKMEKVFNYAFPGKDLDDTMQTIYYTNGITLPEIDKNVFKKIEYLTNSN